MAIELPDTKASSRSASKRTPNRDRTQCLACLPIGIQWLRGESIDPRRNRQRVVKQEDGGWKVVFGTLA
jgi:hypothetical protein